MDQSFVDAVLDSNIVTACHYKVDILRQKPNRTVEQGNLNAPRVIAAERLLSCVRTEDCSLGRIDWRASGRPRVVDAIIVPCCRTAEYQRGRNRQKRESPSIFQCKHRSP